MIEIESQTRTEIVKLRKLKTSLLSILEKTGTHVVNIANVLKDELGDQYDLYSLKIPKIDFSDQEIEEIVYLRKNWTTLKQILEHTKKILIELGENEDLIPLTRKPKELLTKEQITSRFEGWYYKFARELKVGTPRVLGLLKIEAIKGFFNVLEGVPQPSHCRDKLMPVFVYFFFRAKGINVTFSLLTKLSGLKRQKCFHLLKKVNGLFPEYIQRDRQRVIIAKIQDVEDTYHLDSVFSKNAEKILQKLGKFLDNTTDGVIAGTIAALAFISINDNCLTVSKICQRIGITHSAVIFQVKNKLVKKFHISGYTTFNRSKELLIREILEKIVGIQMINSRHFS